MEERHLRQGANAIAASRKPPKYNIPTAAEMGSHVAPGMGEKRHSLPPGAPNFFVLFRVAFKQITSISRRNRARKPPGTPVKRSVKRPSSCQP